MTFTELQKIVGPQEESNWTQHPNGGGWVQKTALVEPTALVEERAIVFGTARVSGDAWVYGTAQVSGNAHVSGTAQVSGTARVSGNAQVNGTARVSGNAHVFGDAWEKSPLYIIGSKYSLTNCKAGHIKIGCKCQTIEWWLQHGEKIADEYGFSAEEKSEYRAYVELFAKLCSKIE